ncbi:MAG TPA: universal stress protein, partial [Thermomicrobiaceae bacterium]|nr:universal stress protein [Thermomicrobiaceae bacterium]
MAMDASNGTSQALVAGIETQSIDQHEVGIHGANFGSEIPVIGKDVPSVIVALDGSASAEQGLRLGATLARSSGEQLQLFYMLDAKHVADLPALRLDAQHYLTEAGAWLAPRLSTRQQILKGTPVARLLDTVAAMPSSILVISQQMEHRLRALAGSTLADKLLPVLSIPLIVVGEHQRIPTTRLHGLLVPLDGSAFAESMLPFAHDFARHYGIPLHLLRVVKPSLHYQRATVEPNSAGDPGSTCPDYESTEQMARAYLDELVDHLTGSNFGPRVAINGEVRVGLPEQEIMEAARHDDVSLIAMSAHGRHGWRQWLQGSTADHITHV